MTYADYNIEIKTNQTGGEYATVCPACSQDRKKKRVKCLSVNLDKQTWFCHHCGWAGGLAKFEKKEYKIPEWKNNTTLSANVVKFFEARKISQVTLQKLQITEGFDWMPKAGKEAATIQFNYFRDGLLVNVKYRAKDKDFKMFKEGELILYNLDCAKDYKELYIVEGEMDCAAFIEAGIPNVVSVPNGATLTANKLDYISNSYLQIKHIEKFIIAVDNDQAGYALRMDLATRLGLSRCFYLEFEGAKDANEFLIKQDANVFRRAVLEFKPFPLEGVFTISDIIEDLGILYHRGLDRGVSTGIPGFNLNFVKGYITTITGIPGHGKSDFLDYICLQLLRFAGWKGVFYSPENKPTELHVSKMIMKLMGQAWDGEDRMTKENAEGAAGYLNEKIWFLKPERDFTLDTMLDRIKLLRDRHGLDYFVIDAWNKLEHKYEGSETKYIGESLDKIGMFCDMENMHCFLVVHPTKMRRQKDSVKYEVPNLYDCSGSSNFANKSDNGITIYRNFEDDDKTTEVFITKIKFKHWGEVGSAKFHYDPASGRFYTSEYFKHELWIK
jgi:twinkle protein